MIRLWCLAIVGCSLVVMVALLDAQTRDAPIPHATGQSVTPAYEGWYPNPDGTFSLSFGYFNRNYTEKLDIPIGVNNRFDPGPEDQGQPTHFLPRRQTGVFTIVVPEDFGDQQVTWTLSAYGETYSIPGRLRPEWQIDALKEVTSGNTPPSLKFDDGPTRQGPEGVSTDLSVEVNRPLTISIWAQDDGVRKSRAAGRPSQFGLEWSKYRGAGSVTFSELEPQVNSLGIASTTVTFETPGEYMLRVLAWDDSGRQGSIMAVGFQCCWTNGYVRVHAR